jgi:hypothetical protein
VSELPGTAVPLGDGSPAAAALAEIEAFAAGSPGFADYWQAAVRQAADTVAAVLAGRRMAEAEDPSGETAVMVDLGDTVLPCPHSVDPELACAALMLAAYREATRRLDGKDPGGPG